MPFLRCTHWQGNRIGDAEIHGDCCGCAWSWCWCNLSPLLCIGILYPDRHRSWAFLHFPKRTRGRHSRNRAWRYWRFRNNFDIKQDKRCSIRGRAKSRTNPKRTETISVKIAFAPSCGGTLAPHHGPELSRSAPARRVHASCASRAPCVQPTCAGIFPVVGAGAGETLSLIHISEPTRPY